MNASSQPSLELPPLPEPPKGSAAAAAPLPVSEPEASRELVQLRQELAATRESLQSMVVDREAMNRQAALIELSRDAVIIRDAQNHITFWNRGAEEVYGWSAEEVRGQLLDSVLKTDQAKWAELNTQLDQTGAWEGELRQFRRDGTPIVVQSREVLVRNEQGSRSEVLSIKRDITERRQLMDGMKEAERRKDEFLAILAHELRNPLAPLRNAVEIMRRAGNNPQALIMARDMLDRQTRQLARIVEDLIDVTRIVEKKIELQKDRVALSAIVETALESCRSLMEGCRHHLTVNLPREPIYLEADAVRLSQVLINLLNNAGKYTAPGGQIRLSAQCQGDQLSLRVRDNGMGISAERLPCVFDMFWQGNPGPQQSRAGLGVGLTLVRSLVQMHGGTVEAHSEGPGHGSEFVVQLPLGHGRTPAAKPDDQPNGPAEPRRVLIVDDNRDQAESLGLLLRMMGHEVSLAFNGRDALTAVPTFRPHVALVDIGLPDISGYDVAQHIRGQAKLSDLVLVAQTGWGQEEHRQRSVEAGFDHHLVKPVSLEVIESILQTSRR